VANKVSNPDLFWALRGGGGSTFGVVVEATIKAHPDIPITFTFWELNVTDPASDGVWDAYTELHRHLADFSSKRISGYYYHYGNRLTGAFLHKADGAGKAKAQAIWEPLLAKMVSFGGLKQSNFSVVEHTHFKSYFDSRFGKLGQMKETPWDQAAKNTQAAAPKLARRHGPGEHDREPVASAIANLDSRLLGAADLAHPDLKAALKGAFPRGLEPRQTLRQGHLGGGGRVARPDDDTSVLPAWRAALTHVIGYKVPGKTSVDALRRLSPGGGAYANEAFALEPDWKKSFWGANYARLSQIKAKWDPDMLLWTTPGINADLYEARAGRVCKRVGAYTKNTAPLSDNANNGRVLGQVN
jgi:FAD/FMN-containing dehydrogenase